MISFVGAGSGDPEYITLKGYRLLQQADLIVYAGSLVNREILTYAKQGARLIDSAPLHLQEIVDYMIEAYNRGENVVRLHTGDPSLFGAIGEQMDLLQTAGIPFQVIPGVSSFLAAAAALQREYTVPDGTQTVIITRLGGRTPVPETEKLSKLAAHQSSMAIFLSVGMIDQVVEQLRMSYDLQTPVAVVEKASWQDERIVQGTLADIAEKTKQAGITKTALILIGEFLQSTGTSKLYDKDFVHEYRS